MFLEIFKVSMAVLLFMGEHIVSHSSSCDPSKRIFRECPKSPSFLWYWADTQQGNFSKAWPQPPLSALLQSRGAFLRMLHLTCEKSNSFLFLFVSFVLEGEVFGEKVSCSSRLTLHSLSNKNWHWMPGTYLLRFWLLECHHARPVVFL